MIKQMLEQTHVWISKVALVYWLYYKTHQSISEAAPITSTLGCRGWGSSRSWSFFIWEGQWAILTSKLTMPLPKQFQKLFNAFIVIDSWAPWSASAPTSWNGAITSPAEPTLVPVIPVELGQWRSQALCHLRSPCFPCNKADWLSHSGSCALCTFSQVFPGGLSKFLLGFAAVQVRKHCLHVIFVQTFNHLFLLQQLDVGVFLLGVHYWRQELGGLAGCQLQDKLHSFKCIFRSSRAVWHFQTQLLLQASLTEAQGYQSNNCRNYRNPLIVETTT